MAGGTHLAKCVIAVNDGGRISICIYMYIMAGRKYVSIYILLRGGTHLADCVIAVDDGGARAGDGQHLKRKKNTQHQTGLGRPGPNPEPGTGKPNPNQISINMYCIHIN